MEDGEDADLKDWRLELRDISGSEGEEQGMAQ